MDEKNLKALAYDLLIKRGEIDKQLVAVQTEIARLKNQPAPPTKPDTIKKDETPKTKKQ